MNQEELEYELGESIWKWRLVFYFLTFLFMTLGSLTFNTNKIFSILSFSAMFLSFYVNARNSRTIF